ncbi:LytR/AlgR family response regulator transcription factor [Dyadobacter sp. CY356]|uniref:LytR/AlgR family response regulator transcription factor n=1 Tax=Dyadobacter sp. CY356 TaxID=2906442 RepID=UPI0038D45533
MLTTQNITTPNEKVIRIHHKKSTIHITAGEILFMRGYGNYTYIHTLDGKCYLFSNTIKHALTILGCSFLRIHRSYSVNPDYLVEFIGSDRVILTNGDQLPVARRRFNHLLEILTRQEAIPDSVRLN